MSVKLLTEHNLELLRLKEAARDCLSLHFSKCHIVGNHMLRLTCSNWWTRQYMYLHVYA